MNPFIGIRHMRTKPIVLHPETWPQHPRMSCWNLGAGSPGTLARGPEAGPNDPFGDSKSFKELPSFFLEGRDLEAGHRAGRCNKEEKKVQSPVRDPISQPKICFSGFSRCIRIFVIPIFSSFCSTFLRHNCFIPASRKLCKLNEVSI